MDKEMGRDREEGGMGNMGHTERREQGGRGMGNMGQGKRR